MASLPQYSNTTPFTSMSYHHQYGTNYGNISYFLTLKMFNGINCIASCFYKLLRWWCSLVFQDTCVSICWSYLFFHFQLNCSMLLRTVRVAMQSSCSGNMCVHPSELPFSLKFDTFQHLLPGTFHPYHLSPIRFVKFKTMKSTTTFKLPEDFIHCLILTN